MFSYGDDYKGLNECDENFKSVFGTIYQLQEIPQDKINEESAYGLYGDDLVGDFYQLRIAIYDTEYIGNYDPKIHDKDFFQSHLGDDAQKGKSFIPIIHIIEGHEREKYIRGNSFPNGPRFRHIMDSGIWNYFAVDNNDFKRDVKEIIKNWKVGYYYLSISQEYADLYARLATQSYLYVGDGIKTGHGADVVPFLFHSETRMAELTKKLDKIQYKWRFLLLDDKIDKDKKEIFYQKEEKTGILSSSNPTIELTKRDILKNRISSILKNPKDVKSPRLKCKTVIYQDDNDLEDNNSDILIVCVETKDKAIDLLKKTEFDIILLDYLLDKKEQNITSPHQYGYELLTDIYKLCEDDEDKVAKLTEEGYKIGPQGKFFFMFISAFTTAVNERLTLEGLSREEDYWLIGEGACPTNTPELFKYRLMHLMNRRLEQTGIRDFSDINILNTVKSIYASKKEESIKGRAERIKSIRQRAYDNYHKILGFHYDYFLLRDKDHKKSRLVDSFLKEKVHFGAMLEHLLQLVHLTAYGTVRQWPEIWEEYKFFSRTYNGKKEDLFQLESDIESYIIDLKSE